MKALYYIKTTLKGMFSNGMIIIMNFILFPILLACFIAYFQSAGVSNPLEMKLLNVQIVDEDNTSSSKALSDFLASDEMKEVVKLTDHKPEVELVIEEGYENNIISLSKGNILINKKTTRREFATETLKVILDKYHQKLYVTIAGGKIEDLNKINEQSIIKNEFIDTLKVNNPYEKISASMIGFLITMLIFSLIQGEYAEVSTNLNKRVNSMPISKVQCLLYDSIALFIYVFIIILSYVMFFRLANLSFKGSFINLMVLVATATILIVSLAKTVPTLFGNKIGKIIGSIIFIIPVIAGEMFMGVGNKITLITPTHYLNNAFSLYNLNGNLDGCGKWILFIIVSSIIIYSTAVIKESINWRKKVCA